MFVYCTYITQVIPRSSVKKEDCPSASMIEVRKNPSQSERMTPSPIEKVLKKYELEHGKSKELDKARGQFSLLVNRDNNFKRKFPEKVSQVSSFENLTEIICNDEHKIT